MQFNFATPPSKLFKVKFKSQLFRTHHNVTDDMLRAVLRLAVVAATKVHYKIKGNGSVPGCVEPQRVFRFAGKHEPRHRAFGLDKWYRADCADVDPDLVDLIEPELDSAEIKFRSKL